MSNQADATCAYQLNDEINSRNAASLGLNLAGTLASSLLWGTQIAQDETQGGLFEGIGAALDTAGGGLVEAGVAILLDVPVVGSADGAAPGLDVAGGALIAAGVQMGTLGGDSLASGVAKGLEVTGLVAAAADAGVQTATQVMETYASSLPFCDSEFTGTVTADANINAKQGISAMDGAIWLGNPDGQTYQEGIALGGGALSGAGTGDLAISDDADAIAIGNGAHAGDGNVAIGTLAMATGEDTTAIGSHAEAIADDATALGSHATASGTSATALGSYAVASGTSSTALGAGAQAFDSNGISGGTNMTALGQAAIASRDNATATGQGAQASGLASSAYGQGSVASAGQTTALGQGAVASSDNATVTGQGAQAGGVASSAYGQGSLASADQSTAIGQGARASGENATATGQGARAGGDDSSAYGQDALALGDQSTAIGAGARAGYANSAAYGANARTTAVNQQVFGTTENRYTMPGLTSAASTAAQSGDLSLPTTDAAGNLAADRELYRQIGQNREGVAMSMALGNFYVPPGKSFAMGMNTATFDGTWAFGLNMGGQVNEALQVNGGAAVSQTGEVSARFGGVVAW